MILFPAASLAYVLTIEAQQKPVPSEPRLAQATPQQQAPASAQPAAQNPRVPSPNMLVMLIRSTLIALNHANRTGNYTVIRDLGAPGFREAKTAAQLAESFAKLRKRNLDLTPIVLIDPKLLREPFINPRGMLRLTGFFPTRPEQVNFDLAFEGVKGRWRLFGISVNTSRAAPARPPSRKHDGAPPVAGASGQPQPSREKAQPVSGAASQPAAPASPPAFSTNISSAPPLPSRKPP